MLNPYLHKDKSSLQKLEVIICSNLFNVITTCEFFNFRNETQYLIYLN